MLEQKYNLTVRTFSGENLLHYKREEVSKGQTRFSFLCDDWVNEENGKVFEMKPYPVNEIRCSCNYNKPSNVRCKWDKVKKSAIRCIRNDRVC